MTDGNGRISRVLINDILRRDGALPAPYIVPISAILQRPDLRPLNYDGALELLSRLHDFLPLDPPSFLR